MCVLLRSAGAAVFVDSPKTWPAPELTIEKTIGVPDDLELSWASLSGKVVVLEFWSTHCAPCVGAIAHLNELAEKFADKPVQFLSITKEDEKTVNRFLRERPIRGWIGLDLDGSTVDAFGAARIPLTVIVDAKGRVVAVTSPLDVTARVIEEVLAGGLPDVPPPQMSEQVSMEAALQAAEEQDPLLALLVRPSRHEHPSSKTRPKSFEALGWSVQDIVARIHDVPSGRVIVPDAASKDRYDVQIRWQHDCGADSRILLAQALGPAFALAAHAEPRTVDAFVLGVPKEAGNLRITKNTVSGTTSYSSTIDGVWRRTNIGMDAFARDLEALLAVPVINETGLSGGYDWELRLDADRPGTIPSAVQEELGLTLTRQRRQVTFVIVESVQADR